MHVSLDPTLHILLPWIEFLMHVTPLFINLQWLPIDAYIKFKALMVAYTSTGSATVYLNSLLQTYLPYIKLCK